MAWPEGKGFKGGLFKQALMDSRAAENRLSFQGTSQGNGPWPGGSVATFLAPQTHLVPNPLSFPNLSSELHTR